MSTEAKAASTEATVAGPNAKIATEEITDADLDEILGLNITEPKFAAPPDITGSIKDRRVKDGLEYFHGALLTAAEVALARPLSAALQPYAALPRVYDDAQPAPLAYRRHVYGPYEKIETDQKVYTMRYASHRGQTKLLACEFEAIQRALKRVPDLKWVLYAGAAPGIHIAFLAELYPGLEFHLVDPAEFLVQRRYKTFRGIEERIHITVGLFTDELAREWAPRAARTIFFSDIRSGNHSQEEFEAEVWINMQMQLRWWETMQPAAAMFKFRLPYTSGGATARVEYLDGEVFLQPFGPNTSTEGRLFVWAGAKRRDYDPLHYENFFFWLNNVVREWADYDHGFDISAVPGLCRCFDCARTVQIFRTYAEDKYASHGFASRDGLVAYLLNRMVAATDQPLLLPPHGCCTGMLPASRRLILAERYTTDYQKRHDKKMQKPAKRIFQYADTAADGVVVVRERPRLVAEPAPRRGAQRARAAAAPIVAADPIAVAAAPPAAPPAAPHREPIAKVPRAIVLNLPPAQSFAVKK
jgi:hypothetical protein